MNNNILNIINNLVQTYNLSQEESQKLIAKYQQDTRDIKIIENELNNYENYYKHQNIKQKAIDKAMTLTNGANYYIQTFDNNSNISLEGVTINLTNQDTNEVLINNSFKGTLKHTNVDNLEIAIYQIGKLLKVDMAEEYLLYDTNKNQNSIVIKDLINNDEFYDIENLKNRFQKLISNGKVKKEKWFDESQNLTIANTKEDYETAIKYGLNIIKELPSILEEDYKNIEKKYFDMILLDSLINQSERKFTDYGIICNKETRRYTFAPLFDNVFPSILKNNDIFYLNGIACNRYELIKVLFNNYYDKIKEQVENIINNKELILKNIDIIAKYNLDINTYNMLINNIITNINYFEKTKNEQILPKNNNNAGFVDIITIGAILAIIIVFSIVISYLLYSLK